MELAARADSGRARWDGWTAAFVGLLGVAVGGFLIAPGELGHKAHAALHGLCAQRPDRIFALGGEPLPFDARMTGLYLGVLVAGVPLLWPARRGVAVGWPWLALLGGFVAVMGLDGVNSLRVDLGLAAWWPPDNRLRLATGLLAGLGLAAALAWLLALALRPVDTPLLSGRDLALWAGGGALAVGVVLSGAGWALLPLTLLLILATLATLGALNLALLALARPPAATWRGLARPATLALALALVEMAALAGLRYGLEAALGRGGVG